MCSHQYYLGVAFLNNTWLHAKTADHSTQYTICYFLVVYDFTSREPYAFSNAFDHIIVPVKLYLKFVVGVWIDARGITILCINYE